MQYFATYFDKNYLSRGLVLYNSLKEHCKEFRLYILCMDSVTFDHLKRHQHNYPEIEVLQISDLENNDPELVACKANRKLIEYYFTLSPCLPLYLLKKYQLAHICTLDADMLFLDNPAPLFEQLVSHSIIITPHKFSKELVSNEKFGIYNVSFQIFKNDADGIRCLELWREQCINWCGDSFDEVNQRFADQKYLDNWMTLYPGKVKSLNDEVSGLAPWNLNNYKIHKADGNYFSNGKRIIFYHFHHYKFHNGLILFNGFYNYKVKHYKHIGSLYLLYYKRVKKERGMLNSAMETPVRYYNSNKLLSNIYYEKTLYFNLFGEKLLLLNFNWLSSILNKILRKNA